MTVISLFSSPQSSLQRMSRNSDGSHWRLVDTCCLPANLMFIYIGSNMCKLLSNPPQSLSSAWMYINIQAGVYLRYPSKVVMDGACWWRDGKGRMYVLMILTNKQGGPRGAPSGVLIHLSWGTDSGCPFSLYMGEKGTEEEVWSVCAWCWHRGTVALIH